MTMTTTPFSLFIGFSYGEPSACQTVGCGPNSYAAKGRRDEPTQAPLCRYAGNDKCWWGDWRCAALAHNSFLYHYWQGSLQAYEFGLYDFSYPDYERWRATNPNICCVEVAHQTRKVDQVGMQVNQLLLVQHIRHLGSQD